MLLFAARLTIKIRILSSIFATDETNTLMVRCLCCLYSSSSLCWHQNLCPSPNKHSVRGQKFLNLWS